MASDHIFDNDTIKGSNDEITDDKHKSSDTSDCPFHKLGLDPSICRAITNPDGYFKLSQPTIVQSRAVKTLLSSSDAKGKGNKDNLFIQSETGSGKF